MEEQIAGESSLPPQIYQPQNRLFVLDLLKALSMIAVVSYHSIFVPKSTYAHNALLLDTLFAPLRFCVPVLTLLSKYSLGIFCLNGIVSQIFLSFGSRRFNEATFSFPEILAIKLIGWGLLFAVSLGLSVLIDRLGGKAVVC